MRKRGKRRAPPTTFGLPITFGIAPATINHGNLLLRSSLEAVLTHTGTEDHVAALLCAAHWARGMCDRLRVDATVDNEQLDPIQLVCDAGLDAIRSVSGRLIETSKVGCSGQERAALAQMLDAHEQIDGVATRRQGRDVLLEIQSKVTIP